MTANTLFTAAAVLTAGQQNNFGRGLMATPATSITGDTSITAEEVMLTYTFTAVNNRNYLLVYHEPAIFGSVSGYWAVRIRETNLTGTVVNTVNAPITTGGNFGFARCETVYTASSSGSLTIVGTLQATAGTGQTQRTSTKFPQLYAIDIGTGY